MKRVFAHIGFSFAITLIVLNLFNVIAALVIFAVTSAAFIISLLIKRTRKSLSVPICLLSSVLACIIFISNYYGSFFPQAGLDGITVDAEFCITDIPREKSNGFYYTVKTIRIHSDNAPQNIKLNLKSDNKINADCYNVIKGRIKLNLISENGFNSYGNFGNGIYLSAKLYEYENTGEEVFSLNKYVLEIKENIINSIKENADKDSAGLIIALVTGDKSYLSDEIKTNFRDSGASHIMAVSGLHLATFAGTIYFLLKKLKAPKILTAIIPLSAVLFYISLSGFSKSMVRAGIMMSIMLVGRLFEEKSDALNSLGFAVFIICLNPYAVTDAGALLTVTAVLGLITVNPHITKRFRPRNIIIAYFYKIFTASVSVFITTLPVMFVFFGYVSICAVFTNLIMIPLAQITLIFSFSALFSFFSNPVFTFILSVPRICASLMISVVSFFAGIPYLSVNICSYEFALAITSVFLLFGICFMLNNKRLLKKCTAISIAVFIIITAFASVLNINSVKVRNICGYNSNAVIVYGNNRAVVAGVSEAGQYTAVRNIIKSGNLHISMIIDTDKNNYSEKLADEFEADNYVISSENIQGTINCKNIFTENNFDVDLWQSFNVKYNCDKYNTYVDFEIYNSKFRYSKKYGLLGENEDAVSLNEYDTVFTVNKYGYSERRLNEWLK